MPAKLTTADFALKSTAVHAGRYSYARAEYANNMSMVRVTCKEHGDFTQRPSHHMSGHGCPRCKTAMTVERCTDDAEGFVRKAQGIHGDLYDYSTVRYERSNKKVEITCRIHGVFLQAPNSHLGRKAGCPKCAGKSMTTEEFIGKAMEVHGDRYDYAHTSYALIKEPVTVTCPTHGDFQQSAEGHLAGHGCRQCWAESYASNGEREICRWVESLGMAVQSNTRDVLDGIEIDVFIPAAKVGIEFNGCYWHSDKVQKNKRSHEFKHACANTNGVRLITVWDFDWTHKQDVVKRHIAHALGASGTPKVGARSCTLEQISSNEANALYDANHLQGACRGGILHLGLRCGETLVAAMTFSKGAARRGIINDGEWELARYATSATVRGGASRLFTAFIRQSGASAVWSFSDKQHFSGGLYETLGFSNDGDLPADYRVVHPAKLITWHKSLWQRKSIPKRLQELGSKEQFDPARDERTEHQMQDAAKVLRVWDAGKTRWVWRK